MSCKHRFFDELIPTWEVEYLFIGTFNPEWNFNNSNAIYFYSRKRNHFWGILPAIFGGESLKNNLSKQYYLDYLKQNKIGLTDLVSVVNNANEKNLTDQNNLTKGFSDAILSKYELQFSTNQIKEFVEKNKSTLKGVYFTRSSSGGIKKIWNEWLTIESLCKLYSIETSVLITPANYRGGVKLKTQMWLEKIKL